SAAAARLSEKVYSYADFMSGEALLSSSDVVNRFDGERVTYHDPCHARHGQGVIDAPRGLLRTAGCDIVEMPNSDACCGFAGSYSLSQPEISQAILDRKLQSIKTTGATMIATDCPGCLIQIRSAIRDSRIKVQALHTAEVLSEAMKGRRL
ncbi:MAG TPA: (Fe-S)-binding protein, partial [Armatimonadota bacterium]